MIAPSAIHEWRALEALTVREKAMDVLTLFPDEMDIGRGLPYYIREEAARRWIEGIVESERPERGVDSSRAA